MFTNVTTLAARPCESRRSGTAASRLWAAAGVSSDLAGGVKAPCPISKLPENEADTVGLDPAGTATGRDDQHDAATWNGPERPVYQIPVSRNMWGSERDRPIEVVVSCIITNHNLKRHP